MTITAAHVGGGLKTVNGDINVGRDSRIEGGILVEKPNLNWSNRNRRPPRIVIGPGAVVEGRLRFEHEVELLVSDRAKIGAVEGAKAVTFSGDEPVANRSRAQIAGHASAATTSAWSSRLPAMITSFALSAGPPVQSVITPPAPCTIGINACTSHGLRPASTTRSAQPAATRHGV